MSERPHIDNLIKLHREWFKDYKASLRTEGEIVHVRWAAPKNQFNSCDFAIGCIHQGLLIAGGDMGDAMYEWHDAITLKFLAETQLDYFAQKCCASETGRKLRSWYPEKVREEIRQHEYFFVGDDPVQYPHFQEYKGQLFDAAEDSQAWMCLLMNLNDADGVETVLGEDWHEIWPDIGYDHHTRLIAHWVGLQMAWEQVKGEMERSEF